MLWRGSRRSVRHCSHHELLERHFSTGLRGLRLLSSLQGFQFRLDIRHLHPLEAVGFIKVSGSKSALDVLAAKMAQVTGDTDTNVVAVTALLQEGVLGSSIQRLVYDSKLSPTSTL